MSTLERAIAIAVAAHAGQTDKAGMPYILHPLRVMFSLDTTEARIVGVLHDVVEDCPDWSLNRLLGEGFSPTVLAALEAVTKRESEHGDENYMAFVARAGADPVGRQVKIADLRDNMDLTRITELSDKDVARLKRYRAAYDFLADKAIPTNS